MEQEEGIKESNKEKKEKPETFWSFLGGLILRTSGYAAVLIFFTISYMGVLGHRYNLLNETFLEPAVGNLSLAMSLTVSTFYTMGYNSPIVYTILFYILVILTFIFPIYQIIMFFIKRRRHTIKKEAQ